MRTLTLTLPGLFGPDMPVRGEDMPELPVLNWLLSRSSQSECHTPSASYQLCELFHVPASEQGDYPIAALTRLGDDNQKPEGIWLRADPVHVSAGRDGLILLDHHRFNLARHDALALASGLSDLVNSKQLKLEITVPERWYIRLKEPQALKTTPIDRVVGKDVLRFMPTGDDRIEWIQLLNELQMSLHACEINQQREADRQLPVNSVWFWGYGELPDIIERKWSVVIGDNILAEGLAMISATPFQQLQQAYTAHQFPDGDYDAIVSFTSFDTFDHYHDLEGWLDALIELERNWLHPVKQALVGGTLDELTLVTKRKHFRFQRKQRFSFWRCGKTLLTERPAGHSRG